MTIKQKFTSDKTYAISCGHYLIVEALLGMCVGQFPNEVIGKVEAMQQPTIQAHVTCL